MHTKSKWMVEAFACSQKEQVYFLWDGAWHKTKRFQELIIMAVTEEWLRARQKWSRTQTHIEFGWKQHTKEKFLIVYNFLLWFSSSAFDNTFILYRKPICDGLWGAAYMREGYLRPQNFYSMNQSRQYRYFICD